MNETEWKTEALKNQSLKAIDCAKAENVSFNNEASRKKIIAAMQSSGYGGFGPASLEASQEWLKANKRIDEDGKLVQCP